MKIFIFLIALITISQTCFSQEDTLYFEEFLFEDDGIDYSKEDSDDEEMKVYSFKPRVDIEFSDFKTIAVELSDADFQLSEIEKGFEKLNFKLLEKYLHPSLVEPIKNRFESIDQEIIEDRFLVKHLSKHVMGLRKNFISVGNYYEDETEDLHYYFCIVDSSIVINRVEFILSGCQCNYEEIESSFEIKYHFYVQSLQKALQAKNFYQVDFLLTDFENHLADNRSTECRYYSQKSEFKRILSQYSTALIAEGKFHKAIDISKKGLMLDKKNGAHFQSLITCYVVLGMENHARKLYKIANRNRHCENELGNYKRCRDVMKSQLEMVLEKGYITEEVANHYRKYFR